MTMARIVIAVVLVKNLLVYAPGRKAEGQRQRVTARTPPPAAAVVLASMKEPVADIFPRKGAADRKAQLQHGIMRQAMYADKPRGGGQDAARAMLDQQGQPLGLEAAEIEMLF